MFIKGFGNGRFHVELLEASSGTDGVVSSGAAPEAKEGGPSSPAAGGAAPAAPAAGTTTPGTATPAPNAASALAAAAPTVTIPEKYQVKNEDGTLNFEASSLKMADGYGNLVKRLGTDDAPPKSAEEYKVAPPEFLKDWKAEEDESFLDFRKDAHAAGLTQKQFDMVIGKYFDLAPKLVKGGALLDQDKCVADLKAQWKTDTEFKSQMGTAYRAAKAYGGDDADGIIDDYGNDPRVVRFMARVGKELKEDSPPSPPGNTPNGTPIAELMTSPAYRDAKHADHARVSAQVAAYFAAQAAAAEKAGTSQIM
jgi:hypothetical protein